MNGDPSYTKVVTCMLVLVGMSRTAVTAVIHLATLIGAGHRWVFRLWSLPSSWLANRFQIDVVVLTWTLWS